MTGEAEAAPAGIPILAGAVTQTAGGRFFTLATGVVAWMAFRRPSVLRTQVPGVALVLLLLRVG